jgi:hypothetical protein
MAGMAASNIVGLAIILTAASTLHPGGITEIETSAQAAEALRPLAGPLLRRSSPWASSARASLQCLFWPARHSLRDRRSATLAHRADAKSP